MKRQSCERKDSKKAGFERQTCERNERKDWKRGYSSEDVEAKL
jgi:hypothetical protein